MGVRYFFISLGLILKYIHMFALRKIIDNSQTNYVLGIQYQVIERETNYEEFCKAFKASFGYDHVADLDENADNYSINCYAFVLTQNYKDIPLYKKQQNYVVTAGGETYSNLTYKYDGN